MEKEINPEESLNIIRRSIENTRRNLKGGSIYFLLWGWLSIAALLVQYFVLDALLKAEQYDRIFLYSSIIWAIALGIGFVAQSIVSRRADKKKYVRTFADRFLTVLWICAAFGFVLMIVLSYFLDIIPVTLILALAAIPTLVTGFSLRYYPIVFGGMVFVAASLVSIFVPGMIQLIVIAAAIILGYLVPGYMLRFSKNNHAV